VKLVSQIPRPVPYEYDLQASAEFAEFAARFGADPVSASTIAVKLLYAALFCGILLALIWASENALRSPWGRMMRAIRDNETAAKAMGKDVTRRHLQIFILGSAVCGLAGAMMVTMDSLHNPGTYSPLRFTFLIWVMVIAGGSGNNWGAILGGFLISFLWLKVEAWGPPALDYLASGLAADSPIREHLRDSAAHMRVIVLGLVLILVLKFSPKGIIPERQAQFRVMLVRTWPA
jgi:branched-chain amino acid transport system permease protein